jgi:hypothetical protein
LAYTGQYPKSHFHEENLANLDFRCCRFLCNGKTYHGNLEQHSNVNCEMVRAYVAQNGLVQARAMAHAAGMTASEERKARGCLAKKI